MKPVSAGESRSFTDSVGVHWMVYCILPTPMGSGKPTLLPHGERRSGWLYFESGDGDRRRLCPFPADWRQVTTFELERWCMRATPVRELPARRHDDTHGR